MLYGLGTVILEEASAQADEKKNALAWLIERNLAELLDYKALLVFRSAFRPVMQLAAKAPSNPPELYEGEGSFQALQQFRWSSARHSSCNDFLGQVPGRRRLRKLQVRRSRDNNKRRVRLRGEAQLRVQVLLRVGQHQARQIRIRGQLVLDSDLSGLVRLFRSVRKYSFKEAKFILDKSCFKNV